MERYVKQITLIMVYNALLQPYFDYCSEVWDTLQYRVARLNMSEFKK